MSQKILFVDDDITIIELFKSYFEKEFEIFLATDGNSAMKIVDEEGPFAVVVSDMEMPQMNGIELFQLMKEKHPDTTRVIMTGYANLESSIKAVNEGHIFRFLTKPIEVPLLKNTILSGLRRYELITAERDLLNKTLAGSIEILSQILNLSEPQLFKESQALRRYIRALAPLLEISDTWEIEIAASLYDLGRLALPPELQLKMQQNQELSSAEKAIVKKTPETAFRLLSKIPRMKNIAQIILYQKKQFNGKGFPEDDISGKAIPLGARHLKILCDFIDLEREGKSRTGAFLIMRDRPGWYDPQLLDMAAKILPVDAEDEEDDSEKPYYEIMFKDLEPGMILHTNILTCDERLLVAAGTRLSEALLIRIENWKDTKGIVEPIFIKKE